MVARAHIAVVDDEKEIRDLLTEYLTTRGYRVSAAPDAEAFRRLYEVEPVDMVLLDVNMPGEDGFSLARSLRQSSPLGIVMLTSAGDVVDRVVGLEIGADDYVTKPFALAEVAARIESVLRRMAGQAGDASRIAIGRLVFDRKTSRLVGESGEEIDMSPSEVRLLSAFLDHPDEVLSRDRLLDLAGGDGAGAFDRSIDVRIARLRKKIEADPSKPQHIKTMRGAGYKFIR